MDNIERLIEFVKVGSHVDFNSRILETLKTLLMKKPTNIESRLLIIGTTSNYDALQLFNMEKFFNLKLSVPSLDRIECARFLGHDINI